MAREWLEGPADAPTPSSIAADIQRLVVLRDAIRNRLYGGEGFELAGWVWIWFAKAYATTAIHPSCERNWDAFLAERSSVERPAVVTVPPSARAQQELLARYKMDGLVTRQFEVSLALKLSRWGEVSRKTETFAVRPGWRSTGLEPDVLVALKRLANIRPDLLSKSKAGKAYLSDRLDRFDLYVALCRVYPHLSDARYSDATLLRCLTSLVACKRGRRSGSHPFVAPTLEGLSSYASSALADNAWLRFFGFRSR